MDNRKWNIFLSLQGNDENTPPTNKDIVTPFIQKYKELKESNVFEYFNQPEYDKILVIGAGDGAEVMSFMCRGYSVIGTSLHHSDKKFAKEYYNIDLMIEDMHDMKSIQSNSYDGIFSSHSLEHAISPLIAIYEMRRILRIGGKVLCNLPTIGSELEIGIQHYSVLRNEHWNHLFNIMGFDSIEIKSSNSGITIKAIKGQRECPGNYFERSLKRQQHAAQ
jgi:SAM-dependent methyltransferase